MIISKVILSLCLFSSVVFAHNDGHGEMCQHLSYLSDLYNRQCERIPPSSSRRVAIGSPGKRGGIGPIGPAGPPGAPGIVNYEIIDRKIATKTDARLREMNENYSKLERQLNLTVASLENAEENIDNFNEKFSRMEEKLNSTLKKLEIGSDCEVAYNGKCFQAIVHDKFDVNFAAAETMCNNGWKLANIYSRAHYDILAEYLRTKVAPRSFISVWLGMTYHTGTKKIHLTEGTQFRKELPWYPGYPSGSTSNNKMYIEVKKVKSSSEGIVNYPAAVPRRGALCEM